MKDNYFYFGTVLDRSGSMGESNKISEAINGFNIFIADKKTKGYQADIMVTMFDDKIETFYHGNLQECPDISREIFFPRGMTALYDAIGKTVVEIGKILSFKLEEERPKKVIIAIITDGMENVSKEFSSSRIGDIIKEQQEKYSWEFLFLGAQEESILAAQKININPRNIQKFADTKEGFMSAYKSYSLSADELTRG